MKNAELEEAQAGIKIAGRNTSNLINADDTTLTAESEEELKSLLMKVKEISSLLLLYLALSLVILTPPSFPSSNVIPLYDFCGASRWHSC